MSDCCGGSPSARAGSCCGGSSARTVLLYACSGGANVAEIADLAARELMSAGAGTMFCLAGLGGDIQGMVQTARDADLNLVLDGCAVDCARKTFQRHGLTNCRYLRVTDLGIEKVKGVRAAPEQTAAVVARARELLRKTAPDAHER